MFKEKEQKKKGGGRRSHPHIYENEAVSFSSQKMRMEELMQAKQKQAPRRRDDK